MVTDKEVEKVHNFIKKTWDEEQKAVDDDEIEQATGISLFGVIEARNVLVKRGLIRAAP